MANKTVPIFEARKILGRLYERRGRLEGILNFVHTDMSQYVGRGPHDPLPDVAGGEGGVEIKGGETTINVGEGVRRKVLTPEDITAYSERIAPILQKLEDLDVLITGIEMALERAEVDTKISIDV